VSSKQIVKRIPDISPVLIIASRDLLPNENPNHKTDSRWWVEEERDEHCKGDRK